jgi:hypothetical protein
MQIESLHELPIKALDFRGRESLLDFARARRESYLGNVPFPHLVIDGLFPAGLLADVCRETKELRHSVAKSFYGSVRKFATNDPQRMGPTTRRLLYDLNSGPFCDFLEALTGIEGILPDPRFEGGGIHEILPGGFLKMHTDFNWNKALKLDRRINVLIYLNEGWREEWGGCLELWDSKMKTQCAKVSPEFNRTVIFSTTDFSFHGHPDPLRCPEGMSRRSLALYYYSNGRPREDVLLGKTTGTDYRERPGEEFTSARGRIRSAFRRILSAAYRN